jgi:hypothetical protein
MANEILIMAKVNSTCTACKQKINIDDFIWLNTFSKKARHKKCKKTAQQVNNE